MTGGGEAVKSRPCPWKSPSLSDTRRPAGPGRLAPPTNLLGKTEVGVGGWRRPGLV